MQRVQIAYDGNGPRYYTFEWSGTMPLVKGDRVVLPPSQFNAEYSFGTVMLTTSEYAGEVKRVTGLVDPDTQHVYYPDGEPE